ncbi:MAG: hypothetical protein EHM13_15425 [Acidobacteria bacterium]|nr:MAG: hypothetical protein EHM13_15425 [Acidobacteriota bacterium]
MKIVPLDRQHLEYHRTKTNALRPDSRGLWGSMDAPHMVCHLRTSVALSVNDHDVIDRSIPIVRTIGRWLVFDTFTTWPRGRFKSPAQFTPEPEGSFEEERRALLQAFDAFVAEAERNPGRKTASPVLGPTTMRYWTHAHGVHLNHHYRQFGLV